MDPLDQLLDEALVLASRKKVTVRNAIPEGPKAPKHLGLADPHNWENVRSVALIHEAPDGTLTLLGNFQESHYKFPGKWSPPRRLTRVEFPVLCDGREIVKGDWWLSPETQRLSELKSWHRTVKTILGITLADLGLHCAEAEVEIKLEFEGISRVELIGDTRFGCPDRNVFMILPKGLDVLSCMTLDSKLALRSEIGL